MKTIIHNALCSLGLPHAKTSQEVVVNGLRKVNVHGCAAGERCTLTAEKIVTRDLAHEWHVEVCMWVDAAGHDIFALGINYCGSLRGLCTLVSAVGLALVTVIPYLERCTHCHDPAMGDVHVGGKLSITVDDGAALR